MKVWLVIEDGCGAHEPEGVMSIWTTEEAARSEAARLCERDKEDARGDDLFWVRSLDVDVANEVAVT